MKLFLSPTPLKKAAEFFRRPTVLAFDFDGTLCPLAKSPPQAHMAERMVKILIELQQTSPIAVISGRAKVDLLRHLPWRPNYVIGNHGIEGLFHPADAETRERGDPAGTDARLAGRSAQAGSFRHAGASAPVSGGLSLAEK